MRSPLVVITGPTASGKSALAMHMAKKYNGELICADSRTVYKGMDIGTAKPTKKDQTEVRHHLLDLVEPDQHFSAAQFKGLANKAIDDITARGKLPIMVGGTGLYVDAVIFDYTFGEPADPKRRAALQDRSIEELQQMCLDAAIPLPVNDQNKRHLVRAIELGGLVQQKKRLRSNTVVVALTTDRVNLRSKVTLRAQAMVKQGIIKEVAALAKKYGWGTEAMTGNIYRIFRPVVEQTLSVEEAIEQFVTSDMQLAKRQVTWLKRNPYIIWGDASQLTTVIEHFVQQITLDQSMPGRP